MQNDLSPVQEVLLRLWQEQYPILYWANRINKINPLNPHDELEAVLTLLQLADTYVTILVAMLQNPNSPWFFVKERAYEHRQIRPILDLFKSPDDGRIDLGNYDTGLDNITSYTPRKNWEVTTPSENWDVRPLDVFVWHFLGCPAIEDYEENQLKFQEDPELYLKVCNGVINFRQSWWHLLNDMKHGFRLLPFEWESMEDIESLTVASPSNFDLDEKRAEYEETKQDYVYFWRFAGKEGEEPDHSGDVPEGYAAEGFGLIVYRIDAQVCTGLARTINFLLNNLVTTTPVTILDKIEPILDESGQLFTFEEFLPITFLRED